jgi:uncharacterized protein (DUF2336 family)
VLAADIMEHSRERALIQISATTGQEEMAFFVGQLYDAQRLTPTLVLRALCVGNVPFFEHAMAVLGQISIANARLLIHDLKPEPLNALAIKAKVPEPLVRVMRIALDIMNQLRLEGRDQDIKRFRTSLIEQILMQTEDLEIKEQEYLLDLIK